MCGHVKLMDSTNRLKIPIAVDRIGLEDPQWGKALNDPAGMVPDEPGSVDQGLFADRATAQRYRGGGGGAKMVGRGRPERHT